MSHVGFHVLLYAVVAAASPLVLTATFIVIRSERPRTNGIAFLSGFMLGTVLACGLGLLVGEATVTKLDAHDTIEGVLTILIGLALSFAGLRARTAPVKPESEGGRGAAILAGLSHVGPAASFSMAGLLGFGGPKRLVLTLLAMSTISVSTLGDVGASSFVAIYIVIATVLVWIPVGIVIIAGEHAAAILARGQSWLTAHAAVLRVWLSLGLGVALIVDGLIRIFA